MNEKELISKFSQLYRERIGESYPPTWGRDIKLFNGMLKEYSQERIERFLEIYFSRKQNIYSIPFFKTSISDLIQIERKEVKDEPKPMQVNENWRFE